LTIAAPRLYVVAVTARWKIQRRTVSILLFVAAALSAQSPDPTLATIALGQGSSTITRSEFRDFVKSWKPALQNLGAAGSTNDLLRVMIDSELVALDKKALGIVATDEDVLKLYRAANPGWDDATIRKAVESQSGSPWDDATITIRAQLALSNYFDHYPAADKAAQATISDRQVDDFYRANLSRLYAPDMIEVFHIFFNTKYKSGASLLEVQKKAADIRGQIASGRSSFEQLAASDSEDYQTAKTGGRMGYLGWPQDDQERRLLALRFGTDFVTRVLGMKEGELSEVLTASDGLHIVKAGRKLPAHVKTLDEPVVPGHAKSVKAAIRDTLMAQHRDEVRMAMIIAVGEQLMAGASITVNQSAARNALSD
jgi:parvulin-like peptidyl-prolyl isomerase